MENINKLKEERPELLTDPDIVQLAEQADMAHNLKALYDSEGGKQLVKLFMQDAVSCVHRLRGGYSTMPHLELVALCAKLDVNISSAMLLMDAKEVKAVLDAELEEALRE
jgi:hypothetical protein